MENKITAEEIKNMAEEARKGVEGATVPMGKVQMMKFADLVVWAQNPRDTPTDDQIRACLALFTRDARGRIQWRKDRPARMSTVINAVYAGCLRITCIRTLPADQHPESIPVEIDDLPEAGCIEYALDSREGETSKPRWAYLQYILTPGYAADKSFPLWVSHLLSHAREVVRIFAPKVDQSKTMDEAVRSANGAMRKYYDIARLAPKAAIDLLIAYTRNPETATEIKSVDRLWRAVKPAPADTHAAPRTVEAAEATIKEMVTASRTATEADSMRRQAILFATPDNMADMSPLASIIIDAMATGKLPDGYKAWPELFAKIKTALPK